MAEFKVKRCRPIATEMTVPGDKSISHRAVMMAALANGPCEIEGFLPSADCLATVNAMRQLGVRINEIEEGDNGPTRLKVFGRGGEFKQPTKPIDCGNSGTTMRLLTGMLAGQPTGFKAELTGDDSLKTRPMRRIIEPLTIMGARITAEGEGDTAPLIIRGAPLHPIDYQLPVASAQVKSAIMLAALSTKGKTTITEPVRSRDHTERMLNFFRVKNLRDEERITIWGGQTLESQDLKVPGDVSSAAFWVVAAAAMTGAHLAVRGIGLNQTRTGILKTLIRMGAQITEVIEETATGEPMGSIEVHGGRLKGTTIEGADIPNVIDELPVIAVAAALADGRTVIRDAKELRVKESDRINSTANNLRLMGVEVQEFFDGMEIRGVEEFKAARLQSHGDHRIAMAFAIAGLFADGETIVEDVECVDTSYPGFYDELKKVMTAKNQRYTQVISSLNPVKDPTRNLSREHHDE
ncbi:MAG: 3-phosphoshikimate 1-carboxyvinyltransferase [Verrucomicrobiales bacterium]|jgi:3-phosphoshikimate 1-carboxyvinyltransferase